MVAIGVVTAALVVVLSVFNGFEDLVRSLYSDFYPDISITASNGKWMSDADSTIKVAANIQGIARMEPVVEERAIIMDGDDKSIVWLKGVTNEYQSFSGISSHLIRGNFETGDSLKPALVLGGGVENALQVIAGQALFPATVYLPNRLAGNNADAMDALHSANAYPAGSFGIQQEFDNQYAFTNIGFMRYMLDLKSSQASSVEVKLNSDANADDVKAALQTHLGNGFVVKTRYQQNQALFVAMQVEKLIIFAVAFLILIIAAFNIISTLTMMVLEKKLDIGVMNAMGTTGADISAIYLKLGGILAGVGGIAGFAIGYLICIGQQRFHWVKLGGESFIIDYYPVAMRFSDFALVGAIILVIALVAGYFPSRRAMGIKISLR